MLSIIKDKKIWSDVLEKFANADIYYKYEYLHSFELHGDGQPTLFYFESKNVRAINATMLRVIPQKVLGEQYYDLITPYGYGGWYFEGTPNDEILQQLQESYQQACQQQLGVISEFVRFHPLLGNARMVGDIYEVINLGSTIAIDLQSENTIWQNIVSKNRNMIRKAIKSNIEIKKCNTKEIFDEFIGIYNATMQRDNAQNYYYFFNNFYDSIREGLGKNSTIYYAQLEDKIIGASIIIWGNDYVHYHLSGALKEFMSLAPMNLLLYTVACDFCKLGYKQMHLGGGLGSDSNSGLFKFKESFNKNGCNQFSIGKKIFDKTKYDLLVQERKANGDFDKNTNFFPAYRA